MRICECIPNFSEGRRKEVIDQIVQEIAKVPDVKITDVQMNADHNRAVVTFIGTPEACKQAAFNACAKAKELIDLTKHKGEHPRIGATDVIPFVPIEGVTMEECVKIARELAKEIWEKLGIPTYLYEEAALREDRRDLAKIRKGEFEGLREEVKTNPERAPDFGKNELHPTAGATVVGAREYLVAYNVNLGTNDLSIAKKIAKAIRWRGGGFRYVKALGFDIAERNIVQVSMNMTNYKGTPLFRAFEFVKREAERYGVNVIGSEIVGVVPLKALIDAAEWYLRLEDFRMEQILELKLWKPEPNPRYFVEEIARNTPTPGGGSVSAASGAQGAALVEMVAGLTIGKEKYKEVEEDMKKLKKEAGELRAKFLNLIDEDAKAFNKVMDAFKLPKGTEEEKAKRKEAIQSALRGATIVPLEVMRCSKKLIELARIAGEKGNVSAVSDAGVAALQARSACEGAYFNVLINLSSIKDEDFKSKSQKEADDILSEVRKKCDEVVKLVREKL